MNFDFKGCNAVITGGTRGIGKAISLKLAELGCNVAMLYLSDHESGEEAQKEAEQFDVTAKAMQCHLGDKNSLKEFWPQYDEIFGGVNFLVSNAATGVHRPIGEISSNSLKKVFAVNIDAFLTLAQESMKRMPTGDHKAGEKGRLLTISSLGAERVLPDYGTVGSSKAALEALTRQFAWENGPSGINANCIRGGLVDTGVLNYIEGKDEIIKSTVSRTPCRRIATPNDIANLACFLLSPYSAMINGQVVTLDGGFSLTA